MKITINPQKILFVAYLLINQAGYDYENNQSGMHKIRKNFRQISTDLYHKDDDFKIAADLIKDSGINEREYPRIVNLLFDKENLALDSHQEKISKAVFEICDSDEMNKLFKQYCEEIDKLKIENLNEKELEKYINEVNGFFHIEKNVIKGITVHINLLESYSRGTNYKIDNENVISASLSNDNKIGWQTLRHEYMHLLLKKLYNENFNGNELIIPTSTQYTNDSIRTKFDENFIIISNLFFINEKLRANNLNYLIDIGFSHSKIFYEFISSHFSKERDELNSDTLNELVSILERE